jgi:CBS domain-containing protein
VGDAVKLLAEHDVSALPVLDANGNLVGVLSEADLIHRVEIGTEKHRPWWLEAVTGASTLAEEFAKSHGKKVGELMTTSVVAVSEETPLSEIAALFERQRIKRVPVVKDGKLVGIVSRANLIQALASVAGGSTSTTKRTARSGSICCLGSKNKRGPVSGARISRSVAAWCTSGARGSEVEAGLAL